MAKIFFSDMIDGTGRGLKYIWDTATGNRRLGKNKLTQNEFVGPLATVFGAGGGLLALMDNTIGARHPLFGTTFYAVWGALIAAPFVAGQLSSLYKTSAHKKALYVQQLEREKRNAPALPAPTRKLT